MRFPKKLVVALVVFFLFQFLWGITWAADSNETEKLSTIIQGIEYRNELLNQGELKLHCSITRFGIPLEQAKSIADKMREQRLQAIPDNISQERKEEFIRDIEREREDYIKILTEGGTTQQEIDFLFKGKKFREETKSSIMGKDEKGISEPAGHMTFIFNGETLTQFSHDTQAVNVIPAEKAKGATNNLCKLIMNGLLPLGEIIPEAIKAQTLTLKEKDPKTGDYILEIVLPERNRKIEVWVSSKTYGINRIEGYDMEGNLLQISESSNYKLVNETLWYPMQTTTTGYSKGEKRTQIVYSVDSFELNIPIEDKSFEFDSSDTSFIED